MDSSKAITLDDEELYAAGQLIQKSTAKYEKLFAEVLALLDEAVEANSGKSIDRLQKAADTMREFLGVFSSLGENVRMYTNRYIRDVDYQDKDMYDRVDSF